MPSIRPLCQRKLHFRATVMEVCKSSLREAVRSLRGSLQTVSSEWSAQTEKGSEVCSTLVNLRFELQQTSSDQLLGVRDLGPRTSLRLIHTEKQIAGKVAELSGVLHDLRSCYESLQVSVAAAVAAYCAFTIAMDDNAEELPLFRTVTTSALIKQAECVCASYRKELTLKHTIAAALRNNKRHSQDVCVVYLASWMMEPYLEQGQLNTLMNTLAAELD